LVRFLLAELMIGTVSQRWVSLTARTGFSLLLAELMIGTLQGARQRCAILQFQSPISGVNDWNNPHYLCKDYIRNPFQSPISGVNDWNEERIKRTLQEQLFQSPISGVNDWNCRAVT